MRNTFMQDSLEDSTHSCQSNVIVLRVLVNRLRTIELIYAVKSIEINLLKSFYNIYNIVL